MDAVAAVLADKVVTDGDPVPVDAYAEQLRTRLFVDECQLPHHCACWET
jgi:hypothetical protein